MKLVNSLIVVATLGVAASASAAYNAYMKIVPASGTFVSATGRSKSGNIPILSFTLPAATPPSSPGSRNVPTRQSNKPMVITIDLNEVPPFTQYMSSGKVLSKVTIYVMTHPSAVTSRVTETILLKNVIVTQVQVGAPKSPDDKTAKITLAYEGVITTQVQAPVTAVDDWTN